MIKLLIRQDDEANLVRAFFARMDGPDACEVGRICLGLVRLHPDIFTAWKDAMTLALTRSVESTGATVVRTTEEKLHERN